MNKKIFSINKHSLFTFICIIYHVLLLLSFTATFFITKNIKITSDLLSMIPSDYSQEAVKNADKAISQNSNTSFFILVSHKDFSKAKDNAVAAYTRLKDNKNIENISLYQDIKDTEEVVSFIKKNRYLLLPDSFTEQTKTEEGIEAIIQDSLSKAFSGITFSGINELNEDPFLLDDINIKSYISALSEAGPSLSAKDGVLSAKKDDLWYVMIRGNFSPDGVKVSGKSNAVPDIYEVCLPLEKDGVRFIFYGTPFHSYKSSKSAQTEISFISTVSVLLVLILLIEIYKSKIPVLFSLFSIVLSVITGVLSSFIIFKNIHVITLVFGTSLIGTSIDYSLHYFINWKCSKNSKDGNDITNHIIKGLTLSLISTEICYLLLYFAPFTILKQISVFSFTGILSSYLTTTGIYPLIKLPPQKYRTLPLIEKLSTDKKVLTISKNIKKYSILLHSAVFIICASVIFVNKNSVKITNNISGLYKIQGRLKKDTIEAYKVINYSPQGYLVLRGSTVQELLEKEEEVSQYIPDPFICTSKLIPSVKKQKNSVKAAETLIPYTDIMFSYYGLENTDASSISEAIKRTVSTPLTPEKDIPEQLNSLLKMLWTGKSGDYYYSIILPSSIKDESVYISLSEKNDGIYFVNKIKDTDKTLDKLTDRIISLCFISFILILIIMKFFFGWKDTLKIASVPFLSITVIITTFILAEFNLEFFCITGTILVFGLGLDYIIYKIVNKNNAIETFAVSVSFITTAISFGSLALSSFIPVKVMGLSIFSGLLTAFIFSII